MIIFFQSYTFEKINNYSWGKAMIIIRIIIMLFLRKTRRKHPSLGLYLF